MIVLFNRSFITWLVVLALIIPAMQANKARAAEGPEAAAETSTSSLHQPETLSGGADFTCGIQSDGTLACWGDNSYGQIDPPEGIFTQVSAGGRFACGLNGDGDLTCWGWDNYGQTEAPAGIFTQVSTGGAHACGLRIDGTLTCWGDNNEGQATPPTGVFIQVSAGFNHTCGLRADGTLACWGWNADGQATPPGGIFTQVTAGYAHTCGLHADGTLACWGLNTDNQATPPAGIFTQVSAGHYHTCGLQGDGALACWGNNSFSQAIPTSGVFTQVSAGSHHGCGLRADGTLSCWGYNEDGQATPPAGSLFGQRRVSTGWDFSCGLRNDGTLACWGENGYDQARPPAGVFTQVSAGVWHTCGLNSNGTLACWGNNDFGQANPPAGVFTQVNVGFVHSCGLQSDGALVCWGNDGFNQATPPDGEFIQLSTDGNHACGLRADGTLSCWGDNGYGQATPPEGEFTQVSAGFYHTCGLRSDGTLACWGDDSAGQATPPNGEFTQVSAGYYHTCGLRGDGTLACWGEDSEGQATPPVGEFAQVSAGFYHTCGLRVDGTLNCWGDNWAGQAPRLSIAPTGLPDGQAGSSYSQLLSASGGSVPYTFKLSAGSLPPGLSLSATGLLNGTPTASGIFNFSVQVVDSWFLPVSVEQEYSLNISPRPNIAPTCQNVLLNTVEDTLGAATPVCSDLDNDPLSYSIVNPPAHGSAAVVDGHLEYNPESDYNGADSFTYVANDGMAGSTQAMVSVAVEAVNDAPVCQNLSVNAEEDSVGMVAPSCSDVDGNSLTYTIHNQPDHGSATVVGGQLEYTPTSNYNGVDDFGYLAHDGIVGSTPAMVSVTVSPVNDAPVCQNVTLHTDEDTIGTVPPDCSDVEGDPLTYSIHSQPTHGSAAVVAGQLEYTPEADFIGLDGFSYIAHDGALESAPAMVYISVGVENSPPTALNDTAITDEDMPVVIYVLANDSDLDGGELSVISTTDPLHGDVTIAADGRITYTPEANINGPDSFSYNISDGQGGTAQASVMVTVNPINDAPTANNDSYQTRYLTALTILQADGLLANDTDVEGDLLSVVLVSNPSHGQITLNPDGSFTYTPDANGIVEDTFSYYVTDGAAQSAVATVTIAIQTFYVNLPLINK